MHRPKGQIIPNYIVIGEDVKVFFVDENSPHDRVYEFRSREPIERLSELIPEGSVIGHKNDERHKAILNQIASDLSGKPRFTLVQNEP
jgi:hypothetical protein